MIGVLVERRRILSHSRAGAAVIPGLRAPSRLLDHGRMPFIHDDFLLQTRTARRLYHEFAGRQPIFDYHCHLPPKDIAENRRFNNLFEIWLEGDHYKWRAHALQRRGRKVLHRRRRSV